MTEISFLYNVPADHQWHPVNDSFIPITAKFFTDLDGKETFACKIGECDLWQIIAVKDWIEEMRLINQLAKEIYSSKATTKIA